MRQLHSFKLIFLSLELVFDKFTSAVDEKLVNIKKREVEVQGMSKATVVNQVYKNILEYS